MPPHFLTKPSPHSQKGFLSWICSFPAANGIGTAWRQLGSSVPSTQVLPCLCSLLSLVWTCSLPCTPTAWVCGQARARTKACFSIIPLVCIFTQREKLQTRVHCPGVTEKCKRLGNSPSPRKWQPWAQRGKFLPVLHLNPAPRGLTGFGQRARLQEEQSGWDKCWTAQAGRRQARLHRTG